MANDNDDVNDAAFGKIDETCPNNDLSFEDDFVPPPRTVTGDTDNGNPQDNSWQADGYLASLEAKLQRLKGRTSSGQPINKRVTARDMLRTLDEARHDSAGHLVSSDSAYRLDADADFSSDTQVGAIKRKMFPEQALTAEELQALVDRDYLLAFTHRVHEEEVEEDETSGSR